MSSSNSLFPSKSDGDASNGNIELELACAEDLELVVDVCNETFHVNIDSEVVMEEVVVAAMEPKSNGLKHNNEITNEVIYIDDSEDDLPQKRLGKKGDKTYSYGIPCSEDALVFPVVNLYTPDRSPLCEVLFNLGFTLIQNRILSELKEADASVNIKTSESNQASFLNIPQKYCECGFKSESKLVLRSHVNLIDNHKLKCCICSHFKTKHVINLAIHMRKEHGVPEHWAVKRPPYPCSFCEYDTSSLNNLKRHTRKCMFRFTLNKNLAPRTESEELQRRKFRNASSSRTLSVIYPNPWNTTSKDTIEKNTTPSQEHSVIVTNISQENIPISLISCGYCRASLRDLQSLGRHMEVAHNVCYSFGNGTTSDPHDERSTVVVLDEDSNSQLFPPLKNGDVAHPSLGSCMDSVSSLDDENGIEIELAKMAIRKECLWCFRKFPYLELFEDHMVKTHNDLRCDVRGFWAHIESGLTECSGQEVAATKACAWCSELFQSSSFCHRHILNCHWESHLKNCDWCKEITSHTSPYVVKLDIGSNIIDLDAVEDNDNSSSSFLSDIDAKESAS